MQSAVHPGRILRVMNLSDLRVYLSDSSVGRSRKLLMVFAVAYLVMPFDAIPDFIPFFGWLDDMGVLGFAAAMLMSDVSRVALARKQLAS